MKKSKGRGPGSAKSKKRVNAKKLEMKKVGSSKGRAGH